MSEKYKGVSSRLGWVMGYEGHSRRPCRQGPPPASFVPPAPATVLCPLLSAWVHPVKGSLGLGRGVSGFCMWQGFRLLAPPGEIQPLVSLPRHHAQRFLSSFSGCPPLGVRLKILIPNHYDMGVRLLLLIPDGLFVCARHFVNEGFLSWLRF